MNNNKNLYCLYSYLSPPNVLNSGHYLIYVFNEHGILPEEQILRCLRPHLNISTSEFGIGPFDSDDLLDKFVLNLCYEDSIPNAYVLGENDFNLLIKNSMKKEDFLQLINEHGRELVNDKVSEKKGFLGKIFQ